MSTSRGRVEDTYEAQNDQRLDELHSKIRTLRGVTTDINDDVERQNLTLDETGDRFNSFGASLAETSRRAGQAFGTGPGGVKAFRLTVQIVSFIVGFWITYKIIGMFRGRTTEM
ncbi:hypothetical protein PLICRDRAFT_145307 [Plicaturopsis crispa FD-325 SS-3]|nr:hypothetical protein PLICRDRAFT_145307 [Plicaturopsis crispa FD-325 SS-3]